MNNHQIKLIAEVVLKNLVVAFSYSIVGHIFESFSTIGSIVSPIFPPTGIAVASILLWGYRVIPGVWLGDFTMMYGLSHYLLLSCYVSTCVILQVGFSAWIFKKFTKLMVPFYHVADVLVLFFCSGFLACLIGSSFGIIGLYLYNIVPPQKFYIAWFDWWLSDALGVITMVTLITAWAKTKIKITLHQFFECVILLVFLCLFAWIEYRYHWPTFILLVFPIWAAIRFNPSILSLVCLITSSLVFYAALHGHKEFQGVDINQTILFAQSYIAITFFVALLLYSIFNEREQAQFELIKTNQGLEKRVKERTADLNNKNIELNEAMNELKRTQGQLIQSEKMSSLGLLTAGIAHEINNAINFISANIVPLKQDLDDIIQFTNKCKEKLSPDQFVVDENINYAIAESNKLMEGINEGVQRSVTIIKDLRSFSRLDEDAVKKVNLHENIDSTLNLLSNSYKDRITIIKKYADVPDIECEPGKINQVFMNILMNAIQAIPDRGEITITTSQTNGMIHISIKDTGQGMSPDIIKKIFDPFFTTKDVGHGTGLGLSISYGIVQDHHGAITVNSELNKGSEFIISLPAQFKS